MSVTHQHKNHKNFDIILIVLVLLSFLIRTYKLDKIPDGLFVDEIIPIYDPFLFQMNEKILSYSSIISYFLQGTYFIYMFMGNSPFFIRLPAAIYGTLMVPLIYYLCKEMFNTRVGILSAVLISLSPWSIIFSRYQVPSMSYTFYFVLALWLFYKGINVNDNRKRYIFYFLGSIVLGLDINTMASARIFIPVFLLGILAINIKRQRLNYLFENIGQSCAFLATAYPVILDYVSNFKSDVVTITNSYSIFNHSSSFLDILILIVERIYLHISIAFIVLDGGLSFSGMSGFNQYIASEGLLKYSTTLVGMLNYYGILIYPSMLLLMYKIIRKSLSINEQVIIIWFLSYLLTAGIAYYDNPNAARNIVGLPVLIICISNFIDEMHSKITNKNLKILYYIFLANLILLPSIYFLADYFNTYSIRSEKAFDYGYKGVSDFIGQNNLWGDKIYLHDEWGREMTLASYSPLQPKKIIRMAKFDINIFSDTKDAIFITRDPKDLLKFEQIGMKFLILKKIYYTDKEIAFLIVQIKN